MRLLHTETLEFEEFFDSDIPEYAILSHRWEGKEMSFQEFQEGNREHHPGFAKIQSCCAVARQRKRDWVWIDTCCIDKKSSTELTEAINSMYRWYLNALECYAYLSDVSLFKKSGVEIDWEAFRASFRQSAWFTRGWTLQELIAPARVMFFDRVWTEFGDKESLNSDVSAATGIAASHLRDANSLKLACVAQKMSWMSKRKTSRLEDIAYCLLGIFDVNMALLYGEGTKAFIRLQLEIIKKSDDESIFAWAMEEKFRDQAATWGMLSPKPDYFAGSEDVHYGYGTVVRRPFSMTNQGLELYVPEKDINVTSGKIKFQLGCYEPYGFRDAKIAVYLRKDNQRWSKDNQKWIREHCERLKWSDERNQLHDPSGGLAISKAMGSWIRKYWEWLEWSPSGDPAMSKNMVAIYIHQPGL